MQTIKPPRVPKPRNGRPEFVASFGRRLGRALTPLQQSLIDDFLPQVELLAPQDVNGTIALESVFGRKAETWLELGFGAGEHLFALAQANPQVNLIGGEPFLNGVAALLSKMQRVDVPNIRIAADDIRPVMRGLADGSLARIYVLFPDPWPKSRHHKRRIISQDFLQEVERLLPVGGYLQIATDHYDYSVWMFEQLFQRRRLQWNATELKDWHQPPEGWSPTRYEMKTRAQGRQPIYLRFTKTH